MLVTFKDIVRKGLLPYIDIYKVNEDASLFNIGVNERDLKDIYIRFQYSLKAEADFEDFLKAETVKDVIDFLYIY